MVVDALGFAASGRELTGHSLAADFERLCHGLPGPQDAGIAWRVTGHRDHAVGQAWLDVWAQGEVRVVCQRCLESFRMMLRVSSRLGLLGSQSQLDAMDALEAEGEGPETEYLVADERLDVRALVEDELILALPYTPRHEVCPQAAAESGPSGQEKASPFAVLEQLRKH